MEIFIVLQWVLLGVFILVVGLCVLSTVLKHVRAKNGTTQKPKKARPVTVQDDVRYTTTDEIETPEGDVQVSYVREDIILQPRKVVVVGKKGLVKPGKYTVLSAYEN